MAQSVSHDLRNHLSAVYSNVEFMSQSRTTEVEREELLEDVHAVIQHMTDMLDSLLLFAKTGQALRPGWVSLNEIVEHAARMVRAHPDARDVNLVIQMGRLSRAGWIAQNLVALFITFCSTLARRQDSGLLRAESWSRLQRTSTLFIFL
jgi:signal transduction histidine kinase